MNARASRLRFTLFGGPVSEGEMDVSPHGKVTVPRVLEGIAPEVHEVRGIGLSLEVSTVE